MDLVLASVDADSHAFFDIGGGYLFAQFDYEFSVLFDVDHVESAFGRGKQRETRGKKENNRNRLKYRDSKSIMTGKHHQYASGR